MRIAIINPGGITNFGERAIMLGTVYSLRKLYSSAEIAIFGYEDLESEDPDLYRELVANGAVFYPSILSGGFVIKGLKSLGMFVAPKLFWPKGSYEYLKGAEVYSKGQETLTENYGFVHFIDSVLEQVLVSRFNKNITLYGQSIGPVRKHKRLASHIIKRFAKVYVRDSRSLGAAKELGYPESQTKQIEDLAYTAVAQYDFAPKKIQKSHYLIIPNYAICTTEDNKKAYIKNLDVVLNYLISRGENVSVASSVSDMGWNNDYKLCELLKERHPKANLKHYKELRELLLDIKTAKYIVSSRLHPLIMATGMGTDVFALSNSHKVIGLLGDRNLSDSIVDPYDLIQEADLRKHL